MSYEPLYVAYLVYFNRDQDYFECHEVLEELWLPASRTLLANHGANMSEHLSCDSPFCDSFFFPKAVRIRL